MIPFKDADEERVMHLESNNIEVMAYDNANDVIHKLFESFLSRCQIGLETSIRERERERERERDRER